MRTGASIYTYEYSSVYPSDTRHPCVPASPGVRAPVWVFDVSRREIGLTLTDALRFLITTKEFFGINGGKLDQLPR